MRKEIQLLLLCLALAWDCSRCASSTRYLDVSNGQDTPECLNSQTSPKNACQTLQYALNNANSEDGSGLSDVHLFVLPGKYTYAEAGIEMWFSKNLTIEKAPGYSGSIVFQCADYSENTYNNFAFLNSSDITIAGLHVEMCGWNSAGLFFENSTSVSVTNCTFTNCTGSGITTLNSNVHISNSCFMDNTGMKVDYLSLSYNVDSSFIRIYTSGAIAVLHSATSTQVVIDNCMFINNSASINEMNRNDSRRPVFKPIGHGGAIVLRFAGNSHNSSVLVTNCLFKNNSADHFGGAIYIPLSTGTESNEIVLSNNSFENNKAGTSGGAVILEIFRTGKSSKLYIKDTNFTDNEATFGGGAVSINHQYPLTIASDSTSELVVFENCVFQGNSAPTGGSAVGLVSNARVDQASLSISFKDCYFIENTAQTRSALLSFRFHMVFLGTVTFQNNSGGAISLLQSRLDSRGTLNITGNAASEGAGLTITDFSLLHLHNGTQVNFKENRAETSGGAILVEDISSSDDFTVIYNILCFVQYEIERSGTRERPTNQWNASVVFTGNTAGISGSGIHATDIGKCTFTGLSCEEMQDDATLFEQSIFHENKGKFHFSAGNFMTGNVSAVSTEPSELKVRQIPENTTSAAPGERKTFLITAFDQSANPSEAIFNYSLSIEESAVQLFGLSAEDTNFTIPFNVSEECAFDNHAFLEFELIQSLSGETVNEVMIPFNIRHCYPGYYLDSNSTVETCKINKHYPYLLRADDRNKYLYLQPGSYAGFHNIGNESIFTVALLPFTFQRCNTQRNRPGCLYKYDQPDDQCFGNRAGFMCGECPQDQGLDLTLTSCRKCNEKDPIVFSFACILVFVLCILVMFFNIGVPNDLRGFLFYAQVVGFVYAKNLGSNSWEYYFSHILGVSFPLPICPFTKLSSLWTVAMGILSPILALLAITVYIISARYLRFLSERTSFSGIWLIILFAYKYTVDTAFNAVKCIKLQGQEIESNYQLKLVFFYDGTIPCFDGEHLILAVPALIVLLLVLFIVPSFIIVIGFKHLKRTQPFTDVITDQIHANCRWWSGFDLIRRVLFVVVVTVSDPQYTQLALCFLTIGILATLCVFKPYKKMVINIIEVVILMDLLIIAVYFLNKKMELHNVSPVVQALLLLPFIYACINVLGRVSLMLRNIFFPTLTVNSLVEKVKASALMKKHYTDEVALVEVNNSGAEGTELCSSYTQLREDLLEYCET